MSKNNGKKQNPDEPRSKNLLVLKGHSSSGVVNDVLKDIALLAKPNCKHLTKKNEILPFEDAVSLEFLGDKNECHMFALGSHTKKRPHNLVLGRFYDGHVLDMIEFGVQNYQTITDFSGPKKGVGSKPVVVFLGDLWHTDTTYGKIQNILLDVFRGDQPKKMSMQGVDHVISLTACEDGNIHMRVNTIGFQKSNSKVPTVSIQPMGPFADLTVRRSQFASEDLWKEATKRGKSTSEPNKVKNVSRNEFGDKLGRLHMKPQNLDKMGGRRVKALRNVGSNSKSRESEAADEGAQQEPKRRKIST